MHLVITIGNISLTYVRFVSPAVTVETHAICNNKATILVNRPEFAFESPDELSVARVTKNLPSMGSIVHHYQNSVRCVNALFCPLGLRWVPFCPPLGGSNSQCQPTPSPPSGHAYLVRNAPNCTSWPLRKGPWRARRVPGSMPQASHRL